MPHQASPVLTKDPGEHQTAELKTWWQGLRVCLTVQKKSENKRGTLPDQFLRCKTSMKIKVLALVTCYVIKEIIYFNLCVNRIMNSGRQWMPGVWEGSFLQWFCINNLSKKNVFPR